MTENYKPNINPLTPTQIGIIKIIKSAIKSTKEELPDGFDFDEAKEVILSHKIVGLVYFGLKNMEIQVPKWLEDTFMSEIVFLTQLWELSKSVMNAFDENGIEYIALKGINTKDLYPNKFMRYMSDVDILIHEEEYEEKIKPIMKKLGWTEGSESDHELHWHKDNVMIELHKRIVPSYNKDYYEVIGDGWEWFKNHSDFEYNFIHFTKHYRDAGIGIAHLVEMEVCWKDIDLSELNLNEFKTNVRKTLDYWFNDGEPDEKSKLITSVIFESGHYGKSEFRFSSSNIKRIKDAKGNTKKAKITNLFRLIFPTWRSWKMRNPILKKAPILLPLFWIVRIIAAPFGGNVKKLADNHSKLGKENDYQDNLTYVGIDYNW